MRRFLKKFVSRLLCYKREDMAATAVEYGLIVGFIAVAIAVTVFAIGEDIEGFFTVIHDYLSSVL